MHSNNTGYRLVYYQNNQKKHTQTRPNFSQIKLKYTQNNHKIRKIGRNKRKIRVLKGINSLVYVAFDLVKLGFRLEKLER